jgi:hypothetical protein
VAEPPKLAHSVLELGEIQYSLLLDRQQKLSS